MTPPDVQAIRDAHVALLELERSGLRKRPALDQMEARIMTLERQVAVLERGIRALQHKPPAARTRPFTVIAGKRQKG